MSHSTLLRSTTTALIICALLATSSPALADKPSRGGGNKGDDHNKRERVDHGKGHARKGDHDRGDKGRRKVHFAERDRLVIREYYDQEYRAGHCPPGLEKKANGCLPPGQAKKWAVGRPLPPEVVYYELPPAITIRLSPPPSGHRYIRVANDILMIAVGTGMVMEALDDLSR